MAGLGEIGADFEFRFFGGGYLGIGIGGAIGGDDEFWSFGGGGDGKEEKRLIPESDARIAIQIQSN